MKKVLRLISKTQIFWGDELEYNIELPPSDYSIKPQGYLLVPPHIPRRYCTPDILIGSVLAICGKNAEVVEIPETIEEAICSMDCVFKYDIDETASSLANFYRALYPRLKEWGIEL